MYIQKPNIPQPDTLLLFYRDKIWSIERAAPKSWSEYTTDELKSEKLIK